MSKNNIDLKEWERVGDGSAGLSVAVYLPKAIRDEMKYKDLIALEKTIQGKVADVIKDEVSLTTAKIEQLLEALFKDTVVKIDIR